MKHDSYILGTEDEELHRLGFQHEVWSQEATEVFNKLSIKHGDRVLDYGSGPGFCTLPLAFRVGREGQVTAVDRSAEFIKYLQQQVTHHGLNVECIHSDFHDLNLHKEAYDVIWGRWVLAWVDKTELLIDQLVSALKPGGKIVFQEYYDWKTFQTEPHRSSLHAMKEGILKSFEASPGFINIGRRLPKAFTDRGLILSPVEARAKLTLPSTPTWYWIKTFLHIYGPKVVNDGHLEPEVLQQALKDFDQLEKLEGSTLLGPLVIEVMATKPVVRP